MLEELQSYNRAAQGETKQCTVMSIETGYRDEAVGDKSRNREFNRAESKIRGAARVICEV